MYINSCIYLDTKVLRVGYRDIFLLFRATTINGEQDL